HESTRSGDDATFAWRFVGTRALLRLRWGVVWRFAFTGCPQVGFAFPVGRPSGLFSSRTTLTKRPAQPGPADGWLWSPWIAASLPEFLKPARALGVLGPLRLFQILPFNSANV